MTVRKIHKNVFMEGFPGVSVVKNPSANARHTGLNPDPGGASGKKKKKKSCCQRRRHKRCRFNPWVWKVSWRRA